MNKANLITLSVIALVLVMAGSITYFFYSTPNDVRDSEAKKTLSTNGAQSFTDLDGNPVTFDQYEGKVRVVNSWASWTPFSLKELADLEVLASEFEGQGVVTIAINRKESKEQAKRFLNALGFFERVHIALDPDDTFYASVQGFSMPETVIYDAEGNIFFHKRGPMTLEEMRTHTQEALQKSD